MPKMQIWGGNEIVMNLVRRISAVSGRWKKEIPVKRKWLARFSISTKGISCQRPKHIASMNHAIDTSRLANNPAKRLKSCFIIFRRLLGGSFRALRSSLIRPPNGPDTAEDRLGLRLVDRRAFTSRHNYL